MMKRRALCISLSLLGLVLLGTVIVLSSVSYYLAIDASAYLTEDEIPYLSNNTRWNSTEHGKVERIPRILHQTWKTDTLPARWTGVSQTCRDVMPDYEYMLWTDESSRAFIAQRYPWFLDTFDGYKYPIQRADAIRYFVLHHYGGIYYDLDIGCLHPLDQLLIYPVILPKTIPVGVSNDLMFAEKGHPFLEQSIHHLTTFDHSWALNYPTVMFSTGPMFISAQYGLYVASHPETRSTEVRILPKSLYGKNAKEGEAPHSFFSHFYGSSWHADDAPFIGFLGTWGKPLMWVGLVILVAGLVRLALPNGKRRKYGLRTAGSYDVLLPRWSQRQGRWYLDLGWFTLAGSSYEMAPRESDPEPQLQEEDMPYLPRFEAQPSTAPSSDKSSQETLLDPNLTPPHPLVDAVRHSRNRFLASNGASGDDSEAPQTPLRCRRAGGTRGVLFFLPVFWSQNQGVELAATHGSPPSVRAYNQRSGVMPRISSVLDDWMIRFRLPLHRTTEAPP